MPRREVHPPTKAGHRGPVPRSRPSSFSLALDQAPERWSHLLPGRRLRSNLSRGHEQLAGLLEVFQQAIIYGPQFICRFADPGCLCRAIQINTLTAVYLGLAVKRQVVGVFANDHTGDGGFGRHAALDQAGFGRGLHNARLAGSAGILWTTGDPSHACKHALSGSG